MAQRRILITGSLGTLGPILRAELEARGHDVYGCDLRHSWNPKEMRADVSKIRQLDAVFKWAKPDITYALAAEFGRNNGESFYEDLWISNQVGNRNTIEMCLQHGSRMVLAGSSEAYGESTTYLEDGDSAALFEGDLDTHPPAFHNEYALSKYTQERQVFIAAQNRKLPAVVLRFFNAFGPGEYYTPYRSVVCLFAYRLMFGLPITIYRNYHRVFQYVGDWARTVANVAERFDDLPRGIAKWHGCRPSSVPVYNIGGMEYRSVEEMAEIVIRSIGGLRSRFHINYVEKEAANVTNKRPDISMAVLDLDHNPTTTLEQGIPRTIEWMKRVYSGDGIPFERGLIESYALEDFCHEAA